VFPAVFFRKLFSHKRVKPLQPSKATDASIRILLVEREDYVRISIRKLLENSFEVVDFRGQFEAVEYIKRNTINVAILSDDLFENINGASLLLSLKENSKQTFRAFALTSQRSDAQRNYLINVGFEDIICKPIKFPEFSDLVYFRKPLL